LGTWEQTSFVEVQDPICVAESIGVVGGCDHRGPASGDLGHETPDQMETLQILM
jgi:hypothetical protein